MTLGRSKAAKRAKVEIAFHSDNHFGTANPAVNVKYYGIVNVSETEYEAICEGFWRDAQIVAHEHGYSGVFSEGRSDGWCIPFYQYKGGELQQFDDWPGQGPELGYPSFPDVADVKERRRFVAFRKAIMALYDDATKQMRNA